jgi:hypothetical protein
MVSAAGAEGRVKQPLLARRAANRLCLVSQQQQPYGWRRLSNQCVGGEGEEGVPTRGGVEYCRQWTRCLRPRAHRIIVLGDGWGGREALSRSARGTESGGCFCA